MDIQYYHNNNSGPLSKYWKGSFTYAVGVPEKQLMTLMLKDFLEKDAPEILLNFGVAKVSPDDQYCKATGRIISGNKMKTLKFKMVSVQKFKDGEIYIQLANEEHILTFTMRPKRSRVFFTRAHDNDSM